MAVLKPASERLEPRVNMTILEYLSFRNDQEPLNNGVGARVESLLIGIAEEGVLSQSKPQSQLWWSSVIRSEMDHLMLQNYCTYW